MEVEYKRAKESLKYSESKLGLLFEQTLLGVIEWNLELQVNEWNPAAETSLTSVSPLQAGQAVSGASANFCRASSSCPQDEQRYS